MSAPAAVTCGKAAAGTAASKAAPAAATTILSRVRGDEDVLPPPSAVGVAPASGSMGMVAGVRRGAFGGAAAEVATPAAVACG